MQHSRSMLFEHPQCSLVWRSYVVNKFKEWQSTLWRLNTSAMCSALAAISAGSNIEQWTDPKQHRPTSVCDLLSVNYEVNQLSTFRLTENLSCSPDSRMSWPTESMAEHGSVIARRVSRPLWVARTMSLWTTSTAVSTVRDLRKAVLSASCRW